MTVTVFLGVSATILMLSCFNLKTLNLKNLLEELLASVCDIPFAGGV